MNEISSRPASGPGYAEHPGYRVTLEPCAKRVRAVFNGETVVDSTRAMLLYETRHLPVYYFPLADLRQDLLRPSDHSSFCPFKGSAAYWSIAVGERVAENAVWGYPEPFGEVGGLEAYRALYWNRVDRWFEEDEEVFVHARDPRVRIDILDSSRPVRVVVGGETLAESRRARFLFETDLPVRYYLPEADVRWELLEPSARRSACPYKGRARYWSVRAGGRLLEDLVWSYPDPVREAARIKDYLCFFNERVDAIFVDGEEQPRPETKWS